MPKQRIIPLIIFLAVLIVYALTLCPTVPPRDSAEFIAVCHTLGVPHPPGYPLYTMLGNLFTHMPHGSIAWRVNLMSAFFGALTVTLTYLIILLLTENLLAALVGCLLFAFAPIFWWLATVAEVFQLNIFFAALTTYILLLWRKKKDFRLLLWFSFLYGLSFSHHHTMILMAPGFVWLIWLTDKKILLNWLNWFKLGGVFLLGLLPYAYLPIRSLANPVIDWGDPQNLNNFLNVVLRRQFGSLKLDPALPNAELTFSLLLADLYTYLNWLWQQFTVAGVIIGLFGAWACFKKDKAIFAFIAISWLISGLGFVILARYPLDVPATYPYCLGILRRFMLPSFFLFALWIGFGITAIVNWSTRRKYQNYVFVLLLILPVAAFSLHYKLADMSHYYFTADLIDNILLSAKPNAIIFAGSDTTLFGLWHAQLVEGKRPDINVISTTQHRWRAAQMLTRWPDLLPVERPPGQTRGQAIADRIARYPGGDDFLADIIKTNIDRCPIYLDINESAELKPFFQFLAPSGLLYQVIQDPSGTAKLNNLIKTRNLWQMFNLRSPYNSADLNDYFTREMLTFYAEAHNFSGAIYAINKQYPEAKKEFQSSLVALPDYSIALFNLKKIQVLGY